MPNRIEASLQRFPGETLRIFFRACEELTCDVPMLELGSFRISELCAALGQEMREAEEKTAVSSRLLSDWRRRVVLVNGWQSWSAAGEMGPGEYPQRAIYKRILNIFADHPAEQWLQRKTRRFAGVRPHVSHFLVVLRAGELRLALVSDTLQCGDATAAANGPLPPLSFIVDHDTITIAAFAEGSAFSTNELLARVAVLAASDYFSLKDRLSRLFNAERRFAGWEWLAGGPVLQRSWFPGGYASWYNHYTDIDEKILGADLEAIAANGNLVNELLLKKGRPAIFQIDDGWEVAIGDWKPHPDKFPSGMKRMAERIAMHGLVPGLWLAPFLVMPSSPIAREHPEWIFRDSRGNPVIAGWNPKWGGNFWCLDLSSRDVRRYLDDLLTMVIDEWGYRYLKLDFLYAGMLRGTPAEGGAVWKHYSAVMDLIARHNHAADGSPVAFLSCGAPIESTACAMPLMRSGADTLEHWDWPQLKLIGHQGRPSAKVNMVDSLGRALLDRTAILCDPDVVFCRTDRTSLRDSEKFLVGLVARMFGSQIMISDDPAAFGKKESPETQASLPLGERTGTGKGASMIQSVRKGDSLSEEAFTQELLSWYAKLGSVEFGVVRHECGYRDVYRFFSRDGSIVGALNLSDRDRALVLQRRQIESGNPEGQNTLQTVVVPAHAMIVLGA